MYIVYTVDLLLYKIINRRTFEKGKNEQQKQ